MVVFLSRSAAGFGKGEVVGVRSSESDLPGYVIRGGVNIGASVDICPLDIK